MNASAPSRPPLISLNDAARQLGIGRTSVYRLIQSGELAVVKIGKRALVDPADLDHLIERSRDAPQRRTAAQ